MARYKKYRRHSRTRKFRVRKNRNKSYKNNNVSNYGGEAVEEGHNG